ncbi:MAG: hypothetical protein AABY18_06420 [Candidatus Thermoplasmatota archaeon]
MRMADGGAPKRPHNSPRIPGAALVGSVLLLAIVVNAAVVGQQPATVTPSAVTPVPVTMSSLDLTTTVTGSTVAQTVNLPFLTTVAIPILDLDRVAPQDWNVQLVVTAASGIAGSEAIKFTIVGDTTQTVTIDTSNLGSLPVSATSVVLDVDGVTISASPTSALALCASCAATVELRITSVSPSVAGLLFVYPLSFDTL